MTPLSPRAATSAACFALLAFSGAAQSQSEPFLGEIRCVGFNFAPIGWALAAGQLLSITQNTALFSLLGTQYGGNGTTTFALPDLRGRAMVNAGQGSGLSPVNLGDQGGAENVTLSVGQMPAHNHIVTELGGTGDATLVSPANGVPATKARTTLYTPGPGTVPMSPTLTSTTGQSLPVPVRSPYLGVNCIIALQGIFPARN
jgi:microcystin-dependent protein